MIEFKKQINWNWIISLIFAFILGMMSASSIASAITLLMVPQGGTGAGTFTAGHVLQGNGTGAIQGSAVSGDATLAAGGALTISANAIEESMLKVVDSPADEECLTYEVTTGDFEWQSCGGAGGYTNLTSFVDQTPWRVFYSNNLGDVTELALGTSGQYLKSTGATGAPTWDTPGGAGDMLKATYDADVDNMVDTAEDLTCTNCINATEIEDIYILKAGYSTGALTSDLNIDSNTLTVSYNDNFVGIGTATPAQKFHMLGDGTSAQGWARFGLSSTEYTEIGHRGSNSAINAVGDGDLDFRHDGTTRASLTDAGVLTATTFSGAFSGALSGNATTATALASNGANCGAGNYPLGVNASGAVESCTADANTTYTGGRSLTLTTTTFAADSELYHHEKCFYIEDPVAADDLKSLFHFRKAATITGMWCESDQTVNMDLQLDDGTPADINGADLVCDSTPADDTSLGGDTGAAAGERLDLAITSVSGTPTWVSICFDFTYDD